MEQKTKKDGFKAGRAFPNSWRDFCQMFKRKIELIVAPRIRKAKHTGSLSKMKEAEIVDRKNKAGGTKDSATVKIRMKKGKFHLGFGIMLGAVSCAFVLFALKPFQAGWVSYLLAFGITGATIYCIDKALVSYFESRWLIFGISALCVGFAIFGHVLISIIRAELFKELYGSSGVSFYSKAVNLLGIALPFLCVSLELGAGLSLFSAKENLWSPDVQDYKELEKYRAKMIEMDAEIERLKNLPEEEELAFSEAAMEGAKEALAPKEKNIEKKLAWIIPVSILIILFLGLFAVKVFSSENEGLTIVALDLSKSSLSKDSEGFTEFKKNLKGVEEVLSQLEPGSRIIVVGITQSSFSNPLIILEKAIPREPGFFKEKLKTARDELAKEWTDRSKLLKAEYEESDIFGVISLASHLLNGKKSAKLILFSDLRHYAGDFDLESPSIVDYENLLKEVEAQGLIPSLYGVGVYCLGVHCIGKSFGYWQSLSKFWEGFFAKSQATLKIYSLLRRFDRD